MNIIAYYPSYTLACHDACVAVVVDGRLVYAYEEQKLSRVIHRESKYFPDRSFLSALYTTGIDPRQIDLLCICGPKEIFDPQEVLKRIERYFGVSPKKVVPCLHHMAHSALAALGSGQTSCMYWTIDAGGEDATYGRFGTFENGKMTDLYVLRKHSLPMFYFFLTGSAGFADFEEGKVMGLASYGQVDNELYTRMRTLFDFDASGHVLFTGPMAYRYPNIRWNKFSHDQHNPHKVIVHLHKELCPALAQMTRGHLPEVIAATGQKLVVDLAVESLRRIRKIHHLESFPVVLGGGFFQNIIVNKAIRQQLDSRVFVPPGVGDMGLAAGAALWAALEYDQEHFLASQSKEPVSAYQGPIFSNKEIKKLLQDFHVSVVFQEFPEGAVAEATAELIAKGRVVGWFQGRAEFGARALGARSVLADPRDKESKARVNQLLKKRDWFMPYAPSILEEHMAEFVKNAQYDPYMTMGFEALESASEKIPAAVHVDGTLRPQIVRKSENPLYHRLISAFKKITGLPVVLNTSFNRHGVPIVATPRQAIEHLLEGVIDHLCVGDFMVSRRAEAPPLHKASLIPEEILRPLLSIRHGLSVLQEGDKEAADQIFAKCGYPVCGNIDNEIIALSINGLVFKGREIDFDEVARALLAQEGLNKDFVGSI